MTTVHVRKAVEFRQTFIDEGVVRGQELHQWTILPHLALEEHLGLRNKGVAQAFVEIGKDPRIRLHHPHVPQLQPLARKIAHQRRRAAVGEHPSDLLFQNLWIFQLAPSGDLEQLVVGDTAPEEKRQPRGQFEVADAIRRITRDVGRIPLHPKQEIRRDQKPLERELDSRLEVPVPPAVAVQTEE